jgi:hypothetical protein
VLAAGAACRRRYDLSFMPSPRRFPPPWSVDEQEACFILRDANGQALAYVYFEGERGRRAAITGRPKSVENLGFQ